MATAFKVLALNERSNAIYDIIKQYPGISRRQIAKQLNLYPSDIPAYITALINADAIYVGPKELDPETETLADTLYVTSTQKAPAKATKQINSTERKAINDLLNHPIAKAADKAVTSRNKSFPNLPAAKASLPAPKRPTMPTSHNNKSQQKAPTNKTDNESFSFTIGDVTITISKKVK